MTVVLKDLIETSKDGEWGKAESFPNSVEMLCIRGTDFDNVRSGILESVPRRFVRSRIATYKALKPWDVVIETAGGTKGQITGRTVLLRPHHFERAQMPITCASFSRFIRFRDELCHPEFVFWFLQYLYAAGVLDKYHTQHTGVARFQWTVFSENEPLDLPDITVQRRVASILSAYDNLIENNLRRIRVLEEMARALYYGWFVALQFDDVECEKVAFSAALKSALGGDWGSEVPTETETRGVFVVRGTDFAELKYGGTRRLPYRYITPSSYANRALRPDDVVVENSVNAKTRSIGSTVLVTAHTLDRLGGEAIAASFCKVFRLHEPALAPLVHLHLQHLRDTSRMEYYQHVATNGIANFQAKKLITEECLTLPTDLTLRRQRLDALAAHLAAANVLASQTLSLRRTRDLLLPRLLSGQINLEDIEPAA